MSTHFQDVNLTANFLCHLHVLDFALVENLHSDFQSCDDMMRDYKTNPKSAWHEIF